MNYEWIDRLQVDLGEDGWYIFEQDGAMYAGPYKTAAAAKGQLTRLRKGYTPAARRPNG